MMDVLNDLINNPISDTYEYDYLLKLKNNNYQRFLKDIEQISTQEFKNFIIDNYKEIKYELDTIKSGFLYDSLTHGINHNIRVLLFTFYLAKKLNLDKTKFRILMDACKYHDVGRRNDLYDEEHGKRSANAVDKIVDDEIYKTNDNLDMLKAIIEYHSVPDRNINKVMSKYKIMDEKTFKILAYLLKDADGLDRVRLSIGNKLFSDLNLRYLRFDDSLTLVKISHIINTMYLEYLKSEKVKFSK